MHIVCPHCTTSYAVNPATLGAAGRNVRCSRCKEVWLARPEDAFESAALQAAATAVGSPHHDDAVAAWNEAAGEEASQETDQETPVVDSPSIAADFDEGSAAADDDWDVNGREDAEGTDGSRRGWFGRSSGNNARSRRRPRRSFGSLPAACIAMAALAMALIVWRADVVRLLPQTASFYRLAGLGVNLRGLSFRDVKVSSETVAGKPVLVIEGVIVGNSRKAVELPRLRFAVRDGRGAEIYAWNTVLDQTVLKPGEHAWFKSRLASPPAEGRSIDVRFFNQHDVAGGSI